MRMNEDIRIACVTVVIKKEEGLADETETEG